MNKNPDPTEMIRNENNVPDARKYWNGLWLIVPRDDENENQYHLVRPFMVEVMNDRLIIQIMGELSIVTDQREIHCTQVTYIVEDGTGTWIADGAIDGVVTSIPVIVQPL